MEKYSKITIDKAVQLTQKCLCCNSITEIEEALNSYNKKNGTQYSEHVLKYWTSIFKN